MLSTKLKLGARTPKSSIVVTPKAVKAPTAVRFGSRTYNNFTNTPSSVNSSSMNLLLAGTVAIGASLAAYNMFEEKKNDEVKMNKESFEEFPLLKTFPS